VPVYVNSTLMISKTYNGLDTFTPTQPCFFIFNRHNK